MKTGWLVVNHFLTTDKFIEHYDWLRTAAKKVDIELTLKTGIDLMNEIGQGITTPEPLPDFVLFGDKDIRLATALENMGLKVFNSAQAISLCDDKSLTHLKLAGQVPMPKTICAPMTYPAIGYPDVSFVKKAADVLGLPMVIKECYGSFGFQVYLANTLEEAEALAKKLAGTPFIMQEFLQSSIGCDVRLQVVGEQVVAAMYRYNDQGDFRANITNGGKMKAYEPTEEQKKLAISACQILGLDFAGVDFLFGKQKEPILCEINSNAHFKNLYSCTGINVAEAIMSHIANKI